jgi:H+/Cl- antiporter ClcA
MLAGFITSPFGGALLGMETARAGVSLPWTMFPSLVASAVGTTVFVLLAGTFFGSLYVFPEYSPSVRDLFLAIPMGLIGAAAGGFFITTFHGLRRAMQTLGGKPVLRGLLGGLGLGLAGAFMPLVLFSGEEQTAVLISDAATIGVTSLIVMAVVKLLITSLCLATGWKGGYIFPTMFAGVALGLATNLVFPGVPIAVAVAATMGGAMVATMKAPVFSALFVMLMVQPETSPAIAIAVIVGLLATARLSMTAPSTGVSTEWRPADTQE